MTFDPEYRMVTLFFSLIFIKKPKIGILEPNILAGTRDPLSISTPYWGPTIAYISIVFAKRHGETDRWTDEGRTNKASYRDA